MWRLLPLAVFVLYGCTEAPAADSVADKRAARIAASRDILAKTPQPRSFRIDGNELKVLDIPVDVGNGYVGIQRCYIWRDVEFKTSNLSCPHDTTEELPYAEGPTQDSPAY